MVLISHRGNIQNTNSRFENNPDYILDAYKAGFNVEIDVWSVDGEFYLGHDQPQYKTDWSFITNPSFWCHAKNFEALLCMKKCGAHYFWHQKDDYTLTSKGFIWTYPNKKISPQSIIVCQSKEKSIQMCGQNVHGICSDFVGVLA